MKRIITLLLIAAPLGLMAQLKTPGGDDKPQKVYSIVREHRPLSFYSTQAELWKQEVEQDPKNADAWLNYYTASRMLKILNGGKTQEDLNEIVEELVKHIPETFEGNYIREWNGGVDNEDVFKYLLKAQQIDPTRPEVYSGLVTHYEVHRDKDNLKKACELWFGTNDMAPGLYTFGYNVLMSLEENGVVLTVGDNDTYPLLVLQQAKNIRPDVAVLNVSLLGVKSYQDQMFKEIGIPVMEKSLESFEDYESFKSALFTHLKTHLNRPLYIGVNVHPDYFASGKGEMYLVGMAYKWSPERFDNMAVLRKNFEQNLLLDELVTGPFYAHVNTSVIDHANVNYLVPLIMLHEHYERTGEAMAQQRVQRLLKNVAKRGHQEEKVEAVLNPGQSSGKSLVLKNTKNITKNLVEIKKGYWASKFEVSNEEFELFMTDLMKQRRFDELQSITPVKTDWESLLPKNYDANSDPDWAENGHPSSGRAPVCNLSYESAKAYCQWLTNFYNHVEEKRKKFKKVLFRLPTEEEWLEMAYSGEDQKGYKFPWSYAYAEKQGADLITNSTGCYLANVNTMVLKEAAGQDGAEMCSTYDGAIFPVAVSSYHPTDFGMYCMIGNVSEMVEERGVAKGGGWNTVPDKVDMHSQYNYKGPDPNVGFRIVMEVIEE